MSEAAPNTDKPLLLIVDDSGESREQIKHYLGDSYRFIEASEGREAIALFEHKKPNVIILDIAMPVMDGIAACEQIRKLPEGRTTPILMLTALDDPESIDNAYKAGADEYITKPVHWSVLKNRIRTLLELNRAGLLERKIKERTIELEEANERLKELDRLKGMFIASMSHELRTPLNSIIGFIGVMLQGMTGEINEEQKDHLQRAFRASRHLLSLISDVIDISKIEAEKVEPFIEEFRLGKVVNEAVLTNRADIEKKKLGLEINVPEDIIIKTDKKRLLQCLINYISNAVKFTKEGKITISASRSDGEIKIIVEDTGVGIKEEDMPKLFKSFVRLEPPMGAMIPGTGLGLYLTKKLALTVLQGKTYAESTFGKGSRFVLEIPEKIEG